VSHADVQKTTRADGITKGESVSLWWGWAFKKDSQQGLAKKTAKSLLGSLQEKEEKRDGVIQ